MKCEGTPLSEWITMCDRSSYNSLLSTIVNTHYSWEALLVMLLVSGSPLGKALLSRYNMKSWCHPHQLPLTE